MKGLLADVNMQGHLPALHRLLTSIDLWPILAELGLSLSTFHESQIQADLDDRAVWNRCQSEGWVFFTDNRNQNVADSLEATLKDSWQIGHLPVITLASKRKFETDREYAVVVATDIAELLFGIVHGEYCDQSRIYVPR
jgi:hypothetical protein